MRYALIADHQQTWPVSAQCAALEVSRSGFYDYLCRRIQPVIDAEEVTLLARVQAIATKTRESYGSRRMARALQDEGFKVMSGVGLTLGRYEVRRLMKNAGISVRR